MPSEVSSQLGWTQCHADCHICLCAFGPLEENERILTDSCNSYFIHLASFGEHLCPGSFCWPEGNPDCSTRSQPPEVESGEGGRPARGKQLHTTIIVGLCLCAPPHDSQGFPTAFSTHSHPTPWSRQEGATGDIL